MTFYFFLYLKWLVHLLVSPHLPTPKKSIDQSEQPHRWSVSNISLSRWFQKIHRHHGAIFTIAQYFYFLCGLQGWASLLSDTWASQSSREADMFLVAYPILLPVLSLNFLPRSLSLIYSWKQNSNISPTESECLIFLGLPDLLSKFLGRQGMLSLLWCWKFFKGRRSRPSSSCRRHCQSRKSRWCREKGVSFAARVWTWARWLNE